MHSFTFFTVTYHLILDKHYSVYSGLKVISFEDLNAGLKESITVSFYVYEQWWSKISTI